ncbi:MAG: LytTR family DNA-binding domain-containing protein [Melioribacteraceae bacterium]
MNIEIKDNKNVYLIDVECIWLIESCGNYCKVYFKDQRLMKCISLNNIALGLPDWFIRVHRNRIVNVAYVTKIIYEDIYINGIIVKGSRRGLVLLNKYISLMNRIIIKV